MDFSEPTRLNTALFFGRQTIPTLLKICKGLNEGRHQAEENLLSYLLSTGPFIMVKSKRWQSAEAMDVVRD